MAPVPFPSAAWLLALLLSASICPIGQAAEKPNIIFFLADDQRWDQMGCAGHPVIQTPHVDQLAREGVRFRNMFVTTSICAASRASIFTGLYERSHRYTFGTVPIARQQTSLSYPALLKQNGYQTGFVGKFGVRVERGVTDEMFHYFKPLNTNPYHKPQPDGSTRHVSQIAGDLAIEFISQQVKDRPFCLSVSFNAPHAEDSDKQNHYPFPKGVAHLYEDSTIAPPRMAAP
ncbi:MAG: sulfatase-like hydrolase/transferase, partial [Planctomycetota bacterium]|nr:sulfatase-like hydrolase/transferase [Planctomycetota bacterium]